jgi:UDP-N-acetylmuramate dehydrogenase
VVFETDTTVHLKVGAGEELDTMVASTVAAGWWGLENLSHIPGTVGAVPVQNVGAYGVEVAALIVSVTVYDLELKAVRELTPAQCQFSYRHSVFKEPAGKSLIIIAVTFALSRVPVPRLTYAELANRVAATGAVPTPALIRSEVIAIRAAKFPDWKTVGTAGSFFKNPIVPSPVVAQLRATYPELPCYPAAPGYEKCSLGFILDKVCGLRGYRVGHVRLYEQQALVLVAESGASAAEIDAFATLVAARVFEKTGITIEREVAWFT